MKKIIFVLILPLLAVCGLLFANRAVQNDVHPKPVPRVLSTAESQAERKKWEASPDGIQFKKWEDSPEGQKVLEGIAKISKQIRESSEMEAVITSLSLPTSSRLGFGVMIRINEVDYILNLRAVNAAELELLSGLQVNDKIIIRSHFVSYAPKYSYPIITGDYIERDRKIIYKHIPSKEGC